MRNIRNKKGFTLIEIMIVVVIIAALASMIVPRLSGRSEQARVSIAEGDVSASISLGLKLYELENLCPRRAVKIRDVLQEWFG